MNYDDIAFTSGFRYERVFLKGSQNFSLSTDTTVTIPHNLGYRPYFKLFYKLGNDKIFPMSSGASTFEQTGSNQIQVDDISSTTTDISVTLLSFDFSSPPTYTGTIYYRIYKEPQS